MDLNNWSNYAFNCTPTFPKFVETCLTCTPYLICSTTGIKPNLHDDVIKWKHFSRYWPFVRGIHRSPVNFPHKGPWRGALMFTLICVRINGWVNNREAGDLRRHHSHYDVIVMIDILRIVCFCFLNLFNTVVPHKIIYICFIISRWFVTNLCNYLVYLLLNVQISMFAWNFVFAKKIRYFRARFSGD